MDIAVEQKATRILTLTAAYVKTFVELTRDYNPLHAEVLSIHPTKPVTQLKITVKRQDGETVMGSKACCYIFR
jgi:hypothetical protein